MLAQPALSARFAPDTLNAAPVRNSCPPHLLMAKTVSKKCSQNVFLDSNFPPFPIHMSMILYRHDFIIAVDSYSCAEPAVFPGSRGPDLIFGFAFTLRHLKDFDAVLVDASLQLCNKVRDSALDKLVVVPLFKKGDQRWCSNSRGITLLSCRHRPGMDLHWLMHW